MTTLKLGKLPPDPTKPALLLAPHLRTVGHPDQRDWLGKVSGWPMYGNDAYGDCVWAMIGHAIEAWTAYNGTQLEVPLEALLKGYHDVTGFDRNDPSTDNGTILQDALNYWKQTGIAGHKILAFAKIDHNNPDEIKTALDIFGALMVGIQFPRVAMDQFDTGQPWDVVALDGGIEGGHAIHLGAFDPNRYEIVTWAKVQAMTNAFADRYVDEIWAVVTPEWYAANGKTPTGLDLYGLGQALHDITGEPNPFTPPQPGTPDEVLAAALRQGNWVNRPHLAGNLRVAHAARTWLKAKSL